ncbi:MAG: dITP/XTP pyrophosphatase [Syntrophus sp. SKADARSKE-3]|nr:dITP/XTP pyrophosphatase [Syntrophus sp. SKADARSKE-3]
MINKIVLASKNQGKVREIEAILSGLPLEIVSIARYPHVPDVIEDGASFLENALKKARSISEYTGETALADDSGLEVDYLKGAPGIYSARFAGENASDEDNNRKLLFEMAGVPAEDRGAAFKCVMVLYEPDGSYNVFEGRWLGRIGTSLQGAGGFGYDPVFFISEIGMTAAELPQEEKNRLSHRAQALKALKRYLEKKAVSS